MDVATKLLAKRLMSPGPTGDMKRLAFLESHIATHIAFQIRSNRKGRVIDGKESWTQKHLGKRAKKKQSVISRLEQTSYGKLSVKTLLDLASAFGVGLQIRFIGFGELLDDRENASPTTLTVPSFDEDTRLNEIAEQAIENTIAVEAVENTATESKEELTVAVGDTTTAKIIEVSTGVKCGNQDFIMPEGKLIYST